MSIVAQSALSDKSTASGQERWARQQALRAAIWAEIRPDVQEVFNAALTQEVAAFLGRPKGQHRAHVAAQPSVLQCATCGCRRTLDFVRKGYYQRTQLTLWGAITVSVPRVECGCGHCPVLPFLTLTPYDRLWSDLTALTLTLVALDVSLRAHGEVVRLPSGTTVSIGTVQRRVQRVGARAAWTMKQPLPQSPPVVMVDAIWGTLMVETGERKRDKKGRLRRVKRGVKVPLLLAESIDPVSGETTLVAWVEGRAESVADWTRLLTVLYERGVQAATGLRLLIHDGSAALEAGLDIVDFGPVRRQRCVFHKLENVLRDVQGAAGMTRPERHERVRSVVDAARAIYEAPTAAEAHQRAAAFATQWGATEPKAVATLQRDFEATLTYYAVQEEAATQGHSWPAVHLRTTSPLEGVNRQLRAKWRQATTFWSTDGWTGALYLVTQRRDRQRRDDGGGWLDHIIGPLLTR